MDAPGATPERAYFYEIEVRPIRNGRIPGRTLVSIASAVCGRDTEKIFGLEACAADQRTIDVGHAHQFHSVRWFNRAAIEDANGFRRIAIPRCETLADERVGLCNVGRGWC